MPDTLIKKYKEIIKARGWHEDAQQIEATLHLQRLLNDLKAARTKSIFAFFKKPEPIKGVYLYGGVGRGKSMLMDMFYDAVPILIPKRRIHFHEFMIEAHDWLHQKRGDRVDDLMPRYAAHVAKKIKLLCFDEFHVTDVADAMILGRLFSALFERGVTVVATSNWAPDNLYEGGLQRDLFMPFIELLKQCTDVDFLDSDTDYRQISDPDQDVYYFYPLGEVSKSKANALFEEFTASEIKTSAKDIVVKGRTIKTSQHAGGVAKFMFADLCEKPHGAEDFIAIAKKFHTVFLKNVPRLTYDRRNEAKRLILLIDCLYEQGCRLVMTAEKPIDALYEGDDHAFEFDRTISRLMEMQSKDYHAKALTARAAHTS